jgi:hypothetical protein
LGVRGGRRGEGKKEECSFLKKRTKKLFSLRPGTMRGRVAAHARLQSFLVLFFKKGLLSFLLHPSDPHGTKDLNNPSGGGATSLRFHQPPPSAVNKATLSV